MTLMLQCNERYIGLVKGTHILSFLAKHKHALVNTQQVGIKLYVHDVFCEKYWRDISAGHLWSLVSWNNTAKRQLHLEHTMPQAKQ